MQVMGNTAGYTAQNFVLGIAVQAFGRFFGAFLFGLRGRCLLVKMLALAEAGNKFFGYAAFNIGYNFLAVFEIGKIGADRIEVISSI